LPCPFFSSTLSTNHCCCYVYCSYKCSRAWCISAESQSFIGLFNRISRLSAQHPTGDEASNGGCNSGPTGHDFKDNFNIYFLFFTIRTGPFPKCENRSGFQIGCQVRTWVVSLDGFTKCENFSIRFSWWLSYLLLIENRDENRRQF